MTLAINEALREKRRAAGRRGGKARAAQPDFIEHQRRAGRRSAEVNDMSALGAKGAKAFIRKYGYPRLFYLVRQWRLAHPSQYEQQVMTILDGLAVCRREIFFSNENNVKLRAIISELQTSEDGGVNYGQEIQNG